MKNNIINILNAAPSNIKNILEQLDRDGILEEILPELTALKGIDKTKSSYHKDNYIHTLQVVENTYYATTDINIRLVSILHDIGKAKTKKWIDGVGWSFHGHELKSGEMLLPIYERLGLPMEHYNYVYKLVINHGHPVVLTNNVGETALRRFILDIGDDLVDMFLFCKCDITTSILEKKNRYIISLERVYDSILEVIKKDKEAEWRCVITGDMIMEHYNLKPCSQVGKIKQELEKVIKDGVIPNEYDIAFEYMKNIKLK